MSKVEVTSDDNGTIRFDIGQYFVTASKHGFWLLMRKSVRNEDTNSLIKGWTEEGSPIQTADMIANELIEMSHNLDKHGAHSNAVRLRRLSREIDEHAATVGF